jgi:predicted transcriptional regulator
MEELLQYIVLVMGKEKKPVSLNEILLKFREYGINISFRELKLAISKLYLLGYVDRRESDFDYLYFLTDKGKKLYVDLNRGGSK